MNAPDVLIYAIAGGALAEPPTFISPMINLVGSDYLRGREEIGRAWEQNKPFAVGGFGIPLTRAELRERYPELQTVSCQWHDGPRPGVNWYTCELDLTGDVAFPGHVILPGLLWNEFDAKTQFERLWRANAPLRVLGSDVTVVASEIVANWPAKLNVYYRCSVPGRNYTSCGHFEVDCTKL